MNSMPKISKQDAKRLCIGLIATFAYVMLALAVLAVGITIQILNTMLVILYLPEAVRLFVLMKETSTYSAAFDVISTYLETAASTAGDWLDDMEKRLSSFWKDHNQR